MVFSNRRKAAKYREYFLDFLVVELPSLIQIFTIILVANNYFLDWKDRVLFATAIASLATIYFSAKLFRHSWESIRDSNSPFNMQNLSGKEFQRAEFYWWYSCSTMLIFLLAAAALAFLTPVF